MLFKHTGVPHAPTPSYPGVPLTKVLHPSLWSLTVTLIGLTHWVCLQGPPQQTIPLLRPYEAKGENSLCAKLSSTLAG